MNELIADKENKDICFSEAEHVYWDKIDKQKYISVTTLIHKYQQEYDSDFWSSYKALENIMGAKFSTIKSELLKTKSIKDKDLKRYDVDISEFYTTKTNILNEWAETTKASCEKGTAKHLEKELEFYKGTEHKLKYFNLGGTFKCERNYYELDLEKGVYPEFLISQKLDNGILRIAGQIDLLIKDGNDLYIIDYKTNKKLDEKSYYNRKTGKYECMKYPLNGIMDCNLMHYTMQLSTYAYLLQLINPNFNVKQLMIIHFTPDGQEVEYQLEYKKDEVALMIKDYNKQMRLNAYKEKRKPIEY